MKNLIVIPLFLLTLTSTVSAQYPERDSTMYERFDTWRTEKFNFHPELKEGEIFVTNLFGGIRLTQQGRGSDLNQFGMLYDREYTPQMEFWRFYGNDSTYRLGNTAYDIDGKILNGARPVFRKIQ